MADTGEPGLVWRAVPIPLPDLGRCVSFELAGRRVLLANVEGTPYAIEDLCPHVRVPLAGGRLVGPVLQCPMHGGRLDVRDGSPVERPIRKAAVVFRLRQNEGRLEIGLEEIGPDEIGPDEIGSNEIGSDAAPKETPCTTS